MKRVVKVFGKFINRVEEVIEIMYAHRIFVVASISFRRRRKIVLGNRKRDEDCCKLRNECMCMCVNESK